MVLLQTTFLYIFINESIFTIFYAYFEAEIYLVPILNLIDKLFFVEYPILYAKYGIFFLAIDFSSLNSLEYMGSCLVEYPFSNSCFNFYFSAECYYNFFVTMPSSICLKII